MRLRWFILFFLLGLFGALLLMRLFLQQPSFTMQPKSMGLEIPLELPEKVVSAEKAITNSLNQLPKGEIYHNVPEKMKVGVSDTIEAGIAPQVTERIKKNTRQRKY